MMMNGIEGFEVKNNTLLLSLEIFHIRQNKKVKHACK